MIVALLSVFNPFHNKIHGLVLTFMFLSYYVFNVFGYYDLFKLAFDGLHAIFAQILDGFTCS